MNRVDLQVYEQFEQALLDMEPLARMCMIQFFWRFLSEHRRDRWVAASLRNSSRQA